jgi:hypothetical protein
MTYQILYIWQILEKKWEYNGTVNELFIDFKKAYDPVRREVLYNVLIEFGIPRKLAGLINHCFSTLLWNSPLGQSRRTRKG